MAFLVQTSKSFELKPEQSRDACLAHASKAGFSSSKCTDVTHLLIL
jgi:hypothetical protein